MPALDELVPIKYEAPITQFMESVKLVGGRSVLLDPGQDINALIKSIYPDASVISSSLPFIEATLNPDTVDEASDINGVEDSSLLHCLVLFISLKVSSRFQT